MVDMKIYVLHNPWKYDSDYSLLDTFLWFDKAGTTSGEK